MGFGVPFFVQSEWLQTLTPYVCTILTTCVCPSLMFFSLCIAHVHTLLHPTVNLATYHPAIPAAY